MNQNVVLVCLLFFFFFFLFRAGLFFQLLSELCFPTWLFEFSKVCFKLSDQASMLLSIPTHCLGEAALAV